MMRFFSRHDPEHCETTELLPWFLNGTLDDLEYRRVERHVAACVLCRRELGHEHEFRDAVVAVAPDAAWRRSFARVESRIDAMESGWRTWCTRRSWRAFAGGWFALSPWARGAIAAQALLVCILAAGLYRASDSPAYRTLGAAPSAVTGETIIVVFDPATPEREIRQVILGEQARVVGGPSPGGAYTLMVKGEDVEGILARLRQNGVVRFAERGAEPPERPR